MTASPGQRDFAGGGGGTRKEIRVGTGIKVRGVQRVNRKAAAVQGIGKVVVGASARFVKKKFAVMTSKKNSGDDEKLLDLGVLRPIESISDVCLGVPLSREKPDQTMVILGKCEIFTDIPGKTSIIKHRVHLVDDHPLGVSQVGALPYAVRGEIREIQEMINIGIERESYSPYTSPIVVMKKTDRSNRICVDYRKLNQIALIDTEWMTTAKDLFQKLRLCQFYQRSIRVRLLADSRDGSGYTQAFKDWETRLQMLDELRRRLYQAPLTVQPTKYFFGPKKSNFWVIWLVGIALTSIKKTWRIFAHPNALRQRRKCNCSWDLQTTIAIIFHHLQQLWHRWAIWRERINGTRAMGGSTVEGFRGSLWEYAAETGTAIIWPR